MDAKKLPGEGVLRASFKDDVAVVSLEGIIDTESARALEPAFTSLIANPDINRLVIDPSRIQSADVFFLLALVRGSKAWRGAGHEEMMQIINSNDEVMALLERHLLIGRFVTIAEYQPTKFEESSARADDSKAKNKPPRQTKQKV